MSNVTTQNEDAYICTSFKLDDDHQYITNIQPLATADIAHHMFAFGCEKPASSSNSWNCESVVCQGPKSILFAWGRNAPALQLPDDVAFKVGPKTSYKYIVVNIHYLKKVSNDRSGLALSVSSNPRRYQAGIMLLISGNIAIPPKTQKYTTKFSCKYVGKTLKVFAYRVHAHVHGDVNAAYRPRDSEWTQLAKGDPQWPQAFYPTDAIYDVKDGDALVGQCTYHNDENKYVYAGSTHNDEMCNIYLMYYTDNADDVMDVCGGNTYPSLERDIPAEADHKPPPPSTFNLDKDNSGGAGAGNPMSHHDMEGSKLHSSSLSQNSNQNENNKKQQQQIASQQNSLAYLLSQVGQQQQNNNNENSDDYYDDVEQGRSKSRGNGGNGPESSGGGDDLQSLLLDSGSLLDLDNGGGGGGGESDDYGSSLTDSASSLLLAAELAKLNKNNKNGESNKKNQALSNKIKNQILNNILPQTVSITRYTLVDKWYDGSKANFGQIGGIAVDQKMSTITVFHRGSQIWETDSFNLNYEFNTKKYTSIPVNTVVTLNVNTGQIVRQFGSSMFYMPHGLKIDSEGNIWLTDVGRHQVLKFAPNNLNQPVLVVGEAMVPGNDKKHFCQPADIAILKNGDFFVADGYCNSRIVKFSSKGEFLDEWSSEDQGMPAHFFVPHSLALHEQQNLLCVADRENYRVQCFDLNGNFLHETSMADYGPVYSVTFGNNNGSVLYAINGYNSRLKAQYEKKIVLISTKSGAITGSIALSADIRTPHSLAVSDDAAEIYIGNLNPPTVFKYMLVNYNFNSKSNGQKSSKSNSTTKSAADPDKDNFRTSMFIMGFLVVPLVLVIITATIARLRHMGKLRRMNIVGLGSGLESKQKELGKWMGRTANSKNRNGFTRLRQESGDEEEAEQLTKTKTHSLSSNGNQENSDNESNSEQELHLPKISKA